MYQNEYGYRSHLCLYVELNVNLILSKLEFTLLVVSQFEFRFKDATLMYGLYLICHS